MEISFSVPIRPVGKARPRFTRFGRAYTPTKTRDFEKTVAWYAKRAMCQCLPIASESPVRVQIEMTLAPPLSWSRKRRSAVFGAFCVKKPDCDNCAKAILDALNGIVFEDDAQVSELAVKKVYGEKDEIKIGVTEVV